MRGMTHEESRRFWAEKVEAWRSSGLSRREFCRREGVSAATFIRWANRLTGESKPDQAPSVPAAFVPVRISEPPPVEAQTASAGMEIVTPRGFVVRVPEGVKAAHLRAVLAAVRDL